MTSFAQSLGQLQRDLAPAEQAGNQAADLAQVQLRPGGPRSPEGDPHELQPRQRLIGAGGHDLERIGAHDVVAFVLQNLKAVDHGAQGPHKVVANPADQKGRKFKVVHGTDGSGHG
jgi:hypothetical protein